MARTTTTRRKDGRGGKNGRSARATASRITEQPTVPAGREREPARLYSTKNDLPESIRLDVIPLLNQRLAECIDLQTQRKQAHWNVKGPSFIGLHKLFDEINESVERSEEHTSELQSHHDLVCRLLLEKKKISNWQ